jgi:phenazine biosynthesis protein phzE
MEFLADHKEIDELYRVVDEELKMMARICDSGCV